MSDESGEDLGDVAMPGFIDILSSVITVFMFFMLITSAIMFFMSIQMKKNVIDESRKQTESKITEEIEEYVHKVQSGEMTLKDLATKVEQIKQDQPMQTQANAQTDPSLAANQSASAELENTQQSRATFSKSTSQKISEDAVKKDMTILFSDRAISITDDTTKSITSFLADAKANAGGKLQGVDIDIPDNPQAATMDISREIGLGRMLNIRNTLLAGKIPPASISVHTITAPPIDKSYDWIRIHVR